MKHVIKFKDALKIKIMALLAVCAMIAISATVVVLADEIIVAEADRQADDSAAYTESEESRKQEFIDPHYYVQDMEVIETETIEEPEEAEAELTLGEQIADFAYSFVDWLPYVWGGESLEYGADCCGFTQAIYRAFGIEIPRTVEEQAYTGYSVSLEDAQPGDIVIYYGHVGLYAGDGMIIHSPYPGTCVSYESVYDQEIQDIRRVL